MKSSASKKYRISTRLCKQHRFFLKAILENFQIALRLGDWHVLCDNHWKFWTFSIIQLWKQFYQKRNLFQKTGIPIFSWKNQDWKRNISVQNCPVRSKYSDKRQIEWEAQDNLITKNGLLSITTLFFRKFCFSLRTSYKVLIWFTNHLNVHIHTFRKRWGFIWGCFFPVSILKIFKKLI